MKGLLEKCWKQLTAVKKLLNRIALTLTNIRLSVGFLVY